MPRRPFRLTLTEEPYDGQAAALLVAALNREVEERYAGVDDQSGPPTPPLGARAAPASPPAGDAAWAVVAADVARPRGTFVVARLDGAPVGCGALRPLPGRDGGHVAEVKRMYTAPEGRRRGVARAVLRHLVGVARELGYERVVLETGTAQPEALALYADEGWSPVVAYGEFRAAEDSRCFGLDLAVRPAS